MFLIKIWLNYKMSDPNFRFFVCRNVTSLHHTYILLEPPKPSAYRNPPILVLSYNVSRNGLKDHWERDGHGWTCSVHKGELQNKMTTQGYKGIQNLFHKAAVLLPVLCKGCNVGQAVVPHGELLWLRIHWEYNEQLDGFSAAYQLTDHCKKCSFLRRNCGSPSALWDCVEQDALWWC